MRLGIIVLTIMCAHSSLNADELTKAETAARNFSYEKLRLGTKLREFKQRFPAAELTQSDKSSGTSAYAFYGSDTRWGSVTFFRGKIYLMMVMYNNEALFKIGGRRVLERKLINIFGTPSFSKGNTHQWTFPNVQRGVRYTFVNDGAAFIVYDPAVEEQLEVVKADKLDLGF